MYRQMKQIVVTLMVVFVLIASIGSSVFATEKIDTISQLKLNREEAILEEIVASWGNDSKVQQIKEIEDFAGNSYLVAECLPTGYIIYNRATGIVMEEAEASPSPYLDVDSGVYSGPAQYFKYDKSAQKWVHCITGIELNDEQVSERVDECQEAQAVLTKDADQKKLNYVNKGEGKLSIQPLAVTNTYIGNRKAFFANLDTKTKMGYWSVNNGVCGYIAAGIVLLYYDKYLNSSFINNSKYLNSTGDAFTGSAFTKHLYNDIGVAKLGYGSSTSASQIAKIMKTYLNDDRNISVTCWDTIMPTMDSIKYQLKNRNIPVIYVDRFNDPSSTGSTTDHDIVVYGYDSSGKLITHFGWVGYTHVKCSSPATAAFISSACAITYY